VGQVHGKTTGRGRLVASHGTLLVVVKKIGIEHILVKVGVVVVVERLVVVVVGRLAGRRILGPHRARTATV
jgi:hypothetical protein